MLLAFVLSKRSAKGVVLDNFISRIAGRIIRRARAPQNRGVLTPGATSRTLSWLKRCAERKNGRPMSTEEIELSLGLDDGGQGYIRQYLRQVDGLAVASKSGMSFDRVRYCVSRAVDLGWFHHEGDDEGNVRRLLTVASVMSRIDEDEAAQSVLQSWKRGKKKSIPPETQVADIQATIAGIDAKHTARARSQHRRDQEALALIERLAV